MNQSSQPKNSLWPIFLTVFIDMLGVGIIIPIVPTLFFDLDTSILPADMAASTRYILYGFLIASYPFMQFFGAPVLGALSDRYGRKPLILISLTGTLIGYLIFAEAVNSHNLIIIFLARMLPGFTGGNISIIMSALSDVSNEKTRVKNFGLVGMAFGLGFVIGPALGGILADSERVSWFSLSTPFLFTALLTVINIIFLKFNFRETLREKRKTAVNFLTGFLNIGKSFRTPHLRVIFSSVLLYSMGFAFYTQFFSVYLIQKFNYSPAQIGMLYGWVGIWLIITQGVIVRRMSGKIAPKKVIPISMIGVGIVMATLLIPNNPKFFYFINPLIAIFHGMTSPNMTSIVSTQAGKSFQGEILGINQSMLSLGNFFPPIIGGFLSAVNGNSSYPLMVSAMIIFVAWGLFVGVFLRGDG